MERPHDRVVVRAAPPFDRFYRAEYARVTALTLALTGNLEIAEDIAQDAFVQAHRHWSRIAAMERPDAYIRTIALNLVRSRARRLRAEARALLRLGRPSAPTMPPESSGFWEAVRGLPRRQAQVVALHYVEDRSVDDIARILGISSGSVKTHLHRARAALAVALGVES